MPNWYTITNKGPDCTEVLIYDEIGMWGISATRFVADLSAIKTKAITLKINSPGGAVFDGFAIFNALKNHPATVNVMIDGLAASIASVIAMAGDTVCIAKNAFMMVHNPAGGCFGYADDLRKQADLLDRLRDSIATSYADKTGKTVEEIKAAMEAETWFDSTEAKAFGLCDSIGGDEGEDDDEESNQALTAAAAVKASLKFTKLPERLKAIAAVASTSTPPTQPTAAPKPPETPMASKIVIRDGKQFVTINGVEHEVEAATPVAPAATNVLSETLIEAAKTEGAKAQRAYDAEFNTALATSGIEGKAAEEFRASFDGLPIKQIKFLASCAIAKRATAVGEGTGGEQKKDKPGDDEATITASEGKRFDEDRNLRRTWNLRNEDSTSAEYKGVRERFIAACIRDHREEIQNKAKKAAMAGSAT